MAALLVWVGLPEVWSSLREIKPEFLLLVCLLQVATLVLIAYQWQVAGKQLGFNVPLLKLIRMNLIGSFVEGLTPSVKAGGEAVKVVFLQREAGLVLPQAMALVTLQKLLSVLPFLSLCLFGIVWLTLKGDAAGVIGQVFTVSLVLLVLLIGCIVVLVLKSAALLERPWPGRLLNGLRAKLVRGLPSWEAAWHRALVKKEIFAHQVVLSVVLWLLFGLKAFLLAVGLGLELSFAQASVATYLAYMVAMLPLSPGGLGSFEASMLVLVGAFGVSTVQGLGFALAVRVATFWLVFLAGGLYVAMTTLARVVRSWRPRRIADGGLDKQIG